MSSEQRELEQRWAARDLNALVSRRVQALHAGSVTDWGLSSRQPDPEVPPISLAGGIPDAATVPHHGLLAAMARALSLTAVRAGAVPADSSAAGTDGSAPAVGPAAGSADVASVVASPASAAAEIAPAAAASAAAASAGATADGSSATAASAAAASAGATADGNSAIAASTAAAPAGATADGSSATAAASAAAVPGPEEAACPCGPAAAPAPDAGALQAAAALSYGGAHGYDPLREQVAQYFARDQSPAIDADHFVLTNGAAGAIDLACSALLDPGDIVITEVPAFSGSLRTIRGHGARLVGVTMDAEGMRMDELEDTLNRLDAAGTPAKLIYVSPTFHNPTGITMPVARRLALLELAARHGVLLLEDTAYNELYFGGELFPTLGALAQGHFVITAGTFSKVIAPGLRVGWLQARPELIHLLMPARFDMGNSPLLHRMLHEFMISGELAAHVARMRVLYHTKMQTLAKGLRDHCGAAVEFAEPAGGFFLWLRLAAPLKAQTVQERALERSVVFPVGRGFFPPEGPQPEGEYLRLAYSRVSVEELRTGAERLAACLETG